MWVIKTKLFGRNILLHQHNDYWVESYKKENSVFCCECNLEYDKKTILPLMDIFPRPNNRSYWEIFDNFRKNRLQINPPPCKISTWNEFGHEHGEESWQPVLWQGQKLCPDCLELAPERDFGDLTSVEDLKKYFPAKLKNKEGEIEEVGIQLV